MPHIITERFIAAPITVTRVFTVGCLTDIILNRIAACQQLVEIKIQSVFCLEFELLISEPEEKC